jgi:inosose dehydratase
VYHWTQYFGDLNEDWSEHLDEIFGTLRDAGITGWEQSITSEGEAERLSRLLERYGLSLPSIYAGGLLCEQNWEDVAARILQQARWAKVLGATILVCNPDPLDWNNPIDKCDEQLRRQATALVALTKELGAIDVTLAYHTHAPEMRQAAREFHHMLLATRSVGMMFCADFHWLYRGAGNSQLATEDMIELYGDRIASTHIRQSHSGVWSESLEEGDLDYAPLASALKDFGYEGPLFIECAREKGTVEAPSMLEAYTKSRTWVEQRFAD